MPFWIPHARNHFFVLGSGAGSCKPLTLSLSPSYSIQNLKSTTLRSQNSANNIYITNQHLEFIAAIFSDGPAVYLFTFSSDKQTIHGLRCPTSDAIRMMVDMLSDEKSHARVSYLPIVLLFSTS
jgi:hypothetical protein